MTSWHFAKREVFFFGKTPDWNDLQMSVQGITWNENFTIPWGGDTLTMAEKYECIS